MTIEWVICESESFDKHCEGDQTGERQHATTISESRKPVS